MQRSTISRRTPQRHSSPLPQVTIQQLDYLVAISEASTWAAAAKELQVSPSALSQGIAELERRLGLKLFESVGRRRVLAQSAQPVLQYATDVIAQTQDLGRWIAEQTSGGSGQLRLGMIDAAALHYFSDVLRVFRVNNPDVDLRLTVGPSGPLLEQVQRNDLDLAVVVRPGELPPDIDLLDLLDDAMGVYSPTGVDTSPSDRGPWVAFPKTSHTRAQIVAHLARKGSSYDVVAESNQPEVLSEMVRLGLGWTVLPVLQAESGPHPLVPVFDEPLFHRPLIAIRRSSALPHPAATVLSEALTSASLAWRSAPGPALTATPPPLPSQHG